MSPRIAVCGFTHETNTYADEALGLTTYRQFWTSRAGQIRERLAGTRTFVGGMLDALGRHGAHAVPLLHAAAQPSGTIAQQDYERLERELLEALCEQGPFDGVLVELHGAAVSEELDDIETHLAAAIRDAVGNVPIVAVLDLHGNLNPDLAQHLDVLLGVQSYPHVDLYERGQEAADLIVAIARDASRPHTHIEKLPVLLPATFTGSGPGAAVNQRCLEAEQVPGVLDCTFFHGFPWADVPVVGSSVAVTTDGDADLARATAGDVARWVWEHRRDFLVTFPAPDEAVRQAMLVEGGPVVINETNDNAGGGAPADGTHLLRALHAAGARACFGFLYDPEAVSRAVALGVGGRGRIAVGGKHGGLGGPPLELDVRVRNLTDGRFTITSPMARGVRVDLGPTARLRAGNLDVIVASGRNQTFDPEVFILHGVDVTRCDIIAVKSQNHFRAGFDGIAHTIITSDAPGVTTADVAALPRTRATTPLWPLDTETEPWA